MAGARDSGGQASPEWIGLIVIVALLMATLVRFSSLAADPLGLVAAVAQRLACAASLGDCDPGDPVDLAYGVELAAAVRDHVPELVYEEGMRALPVDFRSCREDACAEGPESGAAQRSESGEPVTAFTRVIDCRDPAPPPRGINCGAGRAGNLYLQFWLYYPGSATAEGSIAPGVIRTLSSAVGKPSFHRDDWESFQVRIGPDGASERASSHHGYNHRGGPFEGSGASWGEALRRYYISGGSHAGRVGEPAPVPPGGPSRGAVYRTGPGRLHRWTPPASLRLIPLESLERRFGRWSFAVTPPWLKRVYHDPEYAGTD